MQTHSVHSRTLLPVGPRGTADLNFVLSSTPCCQQLLSHAYPFPRRRWVPELPLNSKGSMTEEGQG